MLGTFGFWRSFIAHYADITESLTRLTCKSVAWRWGEEQTSALQRLQAAARLKRPPDVTRPFFVVTDACDYCCGATLEQEDAQGKRHPVAFFSHQLNSEEIRSPVHERELLAVVLALRTWRHHLYGSEFKVQSDLSNRSDKKCEGVKAYPGIERVEGAAPSEEPRSPDELYIPDEIYVDIWTNQSR
jgi:hypothetical protein